MNWKKCKWIKMANFNCYVFSMWNNLSNLHSNAWSITLAISPVFFHQHSSSSSSSCYFFIYLVIFNFHLELFRLLLGDLFPFYFYFVHFIFASTKTLSINGLCVYIKKWIVKERKGFKRNLWKNALNWRTGSMCVWKWSKL